MVLMLCGLFALTAQSPIDPAQAREVFARARALSQKDGGKLWGKTLYGPILLVDPQTRRVVANQADASGLLQASDGLYTGSLPENVIIANSPTQWAGIRWTMLKWPLNGDRLTIDKTLAHEMFHRIQPDLGVLPAAMQPNSHLDSVEGRVWLQMEWRALAAALASEGAAQQQALSDACAFRAYRHSLFGGSSESERQLVLMEGMPEYTGLLTAMPDTASARWYEIARLTSPDRDSTFVGSFAFTSGPGLGMLLDERQPGWRRTLNGASDPGAMLCGTVHSPLTTDAPARAAIYGVAEIRAKEQEREEKLATQKQHYRSLLVEGPTLLIPNAGNFNVGFHPLEVVGLGPGINIYPTMQAKDAWGSLEVTDGAILAADFSSIILAAPAKVEGTQLQGPGWTLQLASGWQVAPASKPGSYVLRHK
jgi:hypothetical protein